MTDGISKRSNQQGHPIFSTRLIYLPNSQNETGLSFIHGGFEATPIETAEYPHFSFEGRRQSPILFPRVHYNFPSNC